jgi:hypothetical protein
VLVLCDHFSWFFYFADNHRRFAEVATFFGLCVWLVPFMFFVSLTANDQTLPTGQSLSFHLHFSVSPSYEADGRLAFVSRNMA